VTPGHAEVRETHGSWVFLAGERAYKLLKPVRTPYFDRTTEERRRVDTEREFELNRRIAPDVYLGVSPVVEGGRVVDHLLVMRRLPDDRRLSLLAGGPEGPGAIDAVGRAVAAFHASLPGDPAAAAVSTPEALADLWGPGNLDELRERAGRLADPDRLDETERRITTWLAGRRPLLESRAAAGATVDGHGDLLAEDVFCLPDGPRLIDCLAFDDDLRRGDRIADIAFLAMDLRRIAGRQAARALLQAWADELGRRGVDEDAPSGFVHVWMAERALVRAKVSALRARQRPDDVTAAEAETREHLDRCVQHLRRAEVRLVVVGGSPGTGKTTVAQRVVDDLDAVVLRSDVVRKELLGARPGERLGGDLDAGAYATDATGRTYDELLRRAAAELGLGRSVVLDATFADPAHRAAVRRAASAAHARVVELRCVADPRTVARRVAQRSAAGSDASDATPEIAAAVAARFAPWPEAIEIDTTGADVALPPAIGPRVWARLRPG
jgi:uncharacterized protein